MVYEITCGLFCRLSQEYCLEMCVTDFPLSIMAVADHGKYLDNSNVTSEKYVQNC